MSSAAVDVATHVPALLRTLLRSPGGLFKLAQPFKSWQGARFNDRFTLSVALGTGRVEWTLLLDAERPSAPPDLVLDEESEALLRGVRYAELQGIREWDASVSSALLWLVSSIRTHLLAAARLDVLTSAGDALKFEVESVLALAPCAEVRFCDRAAGTVECFLPIFAEEISETSGTSGTDGRTALCHLALRLDRTLQDVRAALVYPPGTDESDQTACPVWAAGNSHVFDFLPLVEANVRAKAAAGATRSRFLAALADQITPLSASPTSASFLINLDNSFDAVVHLTLPPSFPQDKPSLVLQSVVQLVDRRPITDIVLDYPFSSEWSADEMAAEMLSVISSHLLKFRGKAIQNVQESMQNSQGQGDYTLRVRGAITLPLS